VNYLGCVCRRLGDYAVSARLHHDAFDLAVRTEDLWWQAYALNALGHLDICRGRFAEASAHHTEALALFRRCGDPVAAADAVGSLGHAELELRRYDRATAHLREALTMFREHRVASAETWARLHLDLVAGQPAVRESA
jgi:tetratricopeptide (TPR) repeat protein